MKVVGAFAGLTPRVDGAAIPGVREEDRARLNAEARDALQDALSAGRDTRHLVVRLEPDAVVVEDRDHLVTSLRRAGITPLAKRIQRAGVPVGHVLLFVNCEDTALVTVSLASLQVTPRLPSSALTPRGGDGA